METLSRILTLLSNKNGSSSEPVVAADKKPIIGAQVDYDAMVNYRWMKYPFVEAQRENHVTLKIFVESRSYLKYFFGFTPTIPNGANVLSLEAGTELNALIAGYFGVFGGASFAFTEFGNWNSQAISLRPLVGLRACIPDTLCVHTAFGGDWFFNGNEPGKPQATKRVTVGFSFKL